MRAGSGSGPLDEDVLITAPVPLAYSTVLSEQLKTACLPADIVDSKGTYLLGGQISISKFVILTFMC